MKSKFIGANRLVLYRQYSRAELGFRQTQLALMNINEHEKIGFFNLGEEYDNRLTKMGFIFAPRENLNNNRVLGELNRCVIYIFLRNGSVGPYFYLGTSNSAKRHDKTHLLLKLNPNNVPKEIAEKLGGFQPLP